MKHVLLPSSAFVRAARRLAKRHPTAAKDFQAALELLAEDAHHPALRTHKLLRNYISGFMKLAFISED